MECGVEGKKRNKLVFSLLRKMANDSVVQALVVNSFHPWGAQAERSRDFAEWLSFALNDGCTSQPADVVEQIARTGVCGPTSVWR